MKSSLDLEKALTNILLDAESLENFRASKLELSGRLDKLSKIIQVQLSGSRNSFFSIYKLHKLAQEKLRDLKNLKIYLSKSEVHSHRTLQTLDNLPLIEIKKLHKEYKDKNSDDRILLLLKYFITKKEGIKWLSKFVEIIDKILIIPLNLKININRDVRFYFRKTQNIIYKNLDDYHLILIL